MSFRSQDERTLLLAFLAWCAAHNVTPDAEAVGVFVEEREAR